MFPSLFKPSGAQDVLDAGPPTSDSGITCIVHTLHLGHCLRSLSLSNVLQDGVTLGTISPSPQAASCCPTPCLTSRLSRSCWPQNPGHHSACSFLGSPPICRSVLERIQAPMSGVSAEGMAVRLSSVKMQSVRSVQNTYGTWRTTYGLRCQVQDPALESSVALLRPAVQLQRHRITCRWPSSSTVFGPKSGLHSKPCAVIPGSDISLYCGPLTRVGLAERQEILGGGFVICEFNIVPQRVVNPRSERELSIATSRTVSGQHMPSSSILKVPRCWTPCLLLC